MATVVQTVLKSNYTGIFKPIQSNFKSASSCASVLNQVRTPFAWCMHPICCGVVAPLKAKVKVNNELNLIVCGNGGYLFGGQAHHF
jgi:hypothetical protein